MNHNIENRMNRNNSYHIESEQVNEPLSIKKLKSLLESKVLGAFSSGLGLNSFESCFIFALVNPSQ